MLKKFIDKIKKIHPIAWAFIGFVIIVIILAIIFSAKANSAATIDVLVSPSTATVTINGKAYENGQHDIKAGDYHVEVTHEDFETHTEEITIVPGENYELNIRLAELKGDIEWYEWYADRPEEDALQTAIASKNYEKMVEEFVAKYPIVSILPYYCTKYEDNYAVYYEYKLYYKMTENDSNMILVIDDAAGNGREDALQYIRNNGFNPDDYQIEYNYQSYRWPRVPDDY
ncbi:MAG: PEGA domain-containing protein [Eggerthellaceae bacterium]|nr:PEGA domain-containing protein [Eggerthellaceae bacterium]